MLQRGEGDGVHDEQQGVRGPEPAAAGSGRRPHPLSGVRFLGVQDAGEQLPRREEAQAVRAGGGDFPARRDSQPRGDQRVDDRESDLAESRHQIGDRGAAIGR